MSSIWSTAVSLLGACLKAHHNEEFVFPAAVLFLRDWLVPSTWYEAYAHNNMYIWVFTICQNTHLRMFDAMFHFQLVWQAGLHVCTNRKILTNDSHQVNNEEAFDLGGKHGRPQIFIKCKF